MPETSEKPGMKDSSNGFASNGSESDVLKAMVWIGTVDVVDGYEVRDGTVSRGINTLTILESSSTPVVSGAPLVGYQAE